MHRQHRKDSKAALRPRLLERLVYLPGAAVLAYGLWLSLIT
ncbi:MAG: hypothetical protein OEN02_11945 [Gammaproteobacteria bacterium]|nr:hypothetical protein [Gammaproteobacteria bacterium]MDH3534754.1 hypothetical protein [Gammaproteobacteria bacterium]